MKTYDKHGISFSYPENWLLEENEIDSGHGSISLGSPRGSFWILSVRPFGSNPDTLAEDALRMMRREYRDMEYSRISRTIAGKTLFGYEMNFYYLDLTNTAVVLALAEEDRTFAIFWQCGDQMVITSEEEPFTDDQVFEAITFSFLQGVGFESEN